LCTFSFLFAEDNIFNSIQSGEMTFCFKLNNVFQENIRRCVCIIYDPSRSDQGVLALKALKLSDSFMELYRSNNFTGEKYEFSSVSSCLKVEPHLISYFSVL